MDTNNIIIQLQGGLGNQLFQYGFARYLELELNKKLKYDISFFKTNARQLKLSYFNTTMQIAKDNEIKKSKFKRKRLTPWKKEKTIYIEDEYYNFGYEVNKIKNGYFIGYWPKTQHLYKVLDNLRKEITVNDKLVNQCQTFANYSKFINQTESVGIHIRRGDYLNDTNKKIFATLNDHYYLEAMNFIKKKTDNSHFFIFTDDLAWVNKLEWIKKEKCHIVSFNDKNADIKDFELLKNCKHHIIANSTFSWWAAFLSETRNSINISPQNWYSKVEYQKLYKNRTILDANFIRM